MFCKILSILPISIILSKPTDNATPAIVVPTSPIIETTIENIDNTNDISKTNESYNGPKTKTIHREGKLPGGSWSFTSKTTTNGDAMQFDTNQFSKSQALASQLFNSFLGKNNKPFINSQELLNSQKRLNEVMQNQMNRQGLFGNQNNDGFFINSVPIKAFFGPQQTNFGNQFLKTNYDRDELEDSWNNKWNGNIMRDSFPINDNSRSQDSYGRMGIQSPFANDDYETSSNYLSFDYTQLILALFVINAVLFIIAYSIKIKRVRQLNRQRSLLEANLRSGGCRDDTTININREKEELPILPKYEDVIAGQDQSVIIPLPKNPDMNNVDQNNSTRIADNQPMDQSYDLPPCETNCTKEESTPPSYDEAK